MTSVLQAAPRRNDYRLSASTTPIDPALTAGGKIIFLRTRRPAPTCNVIAALAGIGPEAL